MGEIRGGYDGRWAQAFCYYCGRASQSRNLERAIKANARHERTHPEFKEPEPIGTLVEQLHADHECVSGPCECRCGCRDQTGCQQLFGALCTHCMVREMRGDDEHGEAPKTGEEEKDRA